MSSLESFVPDEHVMIDVHSGQCRLCCTRVKLLMTECAGLRGMWLLDAIIGGYALHSPAWHAIYASGRRLEEGPPYCPQAAASAV